MNRLRMHIVLLFVVALGTGLVMGVGFTRNTAGGKPPERRSPLAEQLDLTPTQTEQLKAIWSEMVHAPTQPSNRDRREQFRDQRDQAIVALLSESQKTAYDDIQKKYRQQLDQLDEERKQAFAAAVEKTKAILTDTQRTKYEEILKNAPSGRSGRGWDRSTRSPSTHHAPASQPSTPAEHPI